MTTKLKVVHSTGTVFRDLDRFTLVSAPRNSSHKSDRQNTASSISDAARTDSMHADVSPANFSSPSYMPEETHKNPHGMPFLDTDPGLGVEKILDLEFPPPSWPGCHKGSYI